MRPAPVSAAPASLDARSIALLQLQDQLARMYAATSSSPSPPVSPPGATIADATLVAFVLAAIRVIMSNDRSGAFVLRRGITSASAPPAAPLALVKKCLDRVFPAV
jgi:hypothetical protein